MCETKEKEKRGSPAPGIPSGARDGGTGGGNGSGGGGEGEARRSGGRGREEGRGQNGHGRDNTTAAQRRAGGGPAR